MRCRLLAVSAVLVLAVSAWAEGPQRNGSTPRTIRVELSGYSVDLNPLTDPPTPKVVRGFNLLQGQSRPLGPVTATNTGASFGTPAFPLPDWCSGETVVFLPLVKSGYLGLRFWERGELLEAKSVPDPDPPSAPWGLCYDYLAATHPFTAHLSGRVIAGTGRFEGVTGTLEARFAGSCADPPDCSLSPMSMSVVLKLEQ
jgi:hypothetical protein